MVTVKDYVYRVKFRNLAHLEEGIQETFERASKDKVFYSM